MADPEVEQEWEKSKRIEAERIKAVQDLEESKPDKSSLAYLDPKHTKVKGWSKDPDVVVADIERMSNRALIFVIGGVILAFVGSAGGIVGQSFQLGMAGVIISELPSGVGMLLMGLGVLMALITIGVEIYFRIKKGRKIGSSFWTAIAAIVVVGLYIVANLAMARVW